MLVVLPRLTTVGKLPLGPARRQGFPSAEDIPGLAAQNRQPPGGRVLYIAVSEHTVSTILTVEGAKEQISMYYGSYALAGAEVNYPHIEKFSYALVVASRKLRPYFEAHKILVLTNQPLKNVLQTLDASGRLLKWVIELSRCDLDFEPRRAIKAQALADFQAENATPIEEGELHPWP